MEKCALALMLACVIIAQGKLSHALAELGKHGGD